jgi:hypothetical protein
LSPTTTGPNVYFTNVYFIYFVLNQLPIGRPGRRLALLAGVLFVVPAVRLRESAVLALVARFFVVFLS